MTTRSASSVARSMLLQNALEDPTSEDGTPLVPLTPALIDAINLQSSLAERERSLHHREQQLRLKAAWESLTRRSQPTIIGGRDGCHPDALDLQIFHEGPLSCTSPKNLALGELPARIVWIPVPIYHVPVPKPTPYGQALEIGRTTIRESNLTLLFPRPQWAPPLPSRPAYSKLLLQDYSITGFASLSINPVPAEEVARRLDRRRSQEDLETVSPTSDIDSERDTCLGTGPTTLADSPPFTPSNPATHR